MGKRKTILVVDDDPFILGAFRNFLMREGHRMVGARSVSEGVERLFQGRVDLVITELELVGLSATGFPGLIKQIDNNLPVIVMGDLTETRGNAPALKGQADLLLNKPLDLTEIRGAIFRLLTDRRNA